jgi:hypothetical protein
LITAAVNHFTLRNATLAGAWFLDSGNQDASGGVARYYYTDRRQPARLSTEITGYAVSTLLYLHRKTGEARFREGALKSGRFLLRTWDERLRAMPFEWSADGDLPEHLSYFFDCGIIARGLLRAYGVTREAAFLDGALRCGESMRRDFREAGEIHPILALPEKRPVPRDARWSRSPGCYQLKAALAWVELAQATGDAAWRDLYDDALRAALASEATFLTAEGEGERVMDRLHSYGYFLEALQPVARERREVLASGIARAADWLRRIRPAFERSDASAQLLRARLHAEAAAGIALDEAAAAEEAAWCASYQDFSHDAALHGGFWFGSKNGARLPFVNPVSTAFATQALLAWHERRTLGPQPLDWRELI